MLHFVRGGVEKISVSRLKSNRQIRESVMPNPRKLALVLGAIAFALGAKAADAPRMKIGASYMTLNNIFFDPMNASASEAAKKAGADYVVEDSRLDISRQIDGVENLVAQSVSAIILNPVDSDAIVPAVLSANKANIPVFTIDVKSHGGNVVSHITSDNVEAGRLAGDFVAQRLPPGSKVGIIDGPPISTFQQRVEGFTQAINGKLVVGAHQNALQNTPEAFTAITENLITGNPDLKAIFAVNDNAAEAAAAAIEGAKRKDVWVVGVDGIPSTVKTIAQDGIIKATVGQQPGQMGRLAVEAATGYLHGEKVPPEIKAPLMLVTKENAASFHW
jgi:ribose transport system substrate-binding protein